MELDFNGQGEILCVDKPQGWTSFDVVRKVRNLFHIRKIGHAGTLDPNATGLLVLCTGPKTRQLNEFLEYDKTYSGTFEIGMETPSYDIETEVTRRSEWKHVTDEMMDRAVRSFTGPLEQIPPMYSALKHKGRPLYSYARKGKEVPRPPRNVVVSEFTITASRPPQFQFELRCSKGTYVRSLVHDIGGMLGTGAVLTELRRTSIGPWTLDGAYTIQRLTEMKQALQVNGDSGDGIRA